MQLKTLLPSLLLLALRSEYAFAASDDVKASVPGAEPLLTKAISVKVSKRSLLMQPHYIAAPLEHTGLLSKRQTTTCPPDVVTCTAFAGCCPAETVCGIYGGEKGCCPEGKMCSGVGGCSKDWVDCGSEVCCLPGSVCTKDTLGKPACGKGDDDNTGDDDNDVGEDGCPSGYSSCSIFDGCCPTGAECVLPSNCKIPCSTSDPRCGTGCCTGGSVCRNDRCVLVDTDTETDFTDLPGPSTTTRVTITTTSTVEDPETTEDEETATTEESSTETTSTSTRDVFGNDNEEDATTTTSGTSTISRVPIPNTTTPTDNDNTAPTMGSLIGNGLGVAAGLIGALVL